MQPGKCSVRSNAAVIFSFYCQIRIQEMLTEINILALDTVVVRSLSGGLLEEKWIVSKLSIPANEIKHYPVGWPTSCFFLFLSHNKLLRGLPIG